MKKPKSKLPPIDQAQYGCRSYVGTIKVEPKPLPKDKRRKPWPTIRKYKFEGIKTDIDYLAALIKRNEKKMLEVMGASAFQRGVKSAKAEKQKA